MTSAFQFSSLFCIAFLALNVDCFRQFPVGKKNGRDAMGTMLAGVNGGSEQSAVLSRAAAFIVGSTLPFLFNLDIGETGQNHLTSFCTPKHAVADSTGKMSTKLTARKRYLPRVKAGVTEFKKLSQSLDAASLATFQTDSVSFVRAMDLYGVSLRKGETPDGISRTAKQLTDTFATEVKKLEKAKGDANILSQYNSCLVALDNYLEYAKMPISSDASYL